MVKQIQKTGWGEVTKWYEETVNAESSVQQEVILPGLLPFFKNLIKDKVVLDLGCGTGFFIHALLISGAKKVIAVDVDDSLLQVVRDRYGKTDKVEIVKADAEKILGVENSSVDVVLSVESLVNMRRLDKVTSEMKRVLKGDGKILAVVNHPCFRVPQSSDWHYDVLKHKQGRVTYKYASPHEISIDMNPGSKTNKKFTYTFHRSLSEYMKFFNQGRLSITDIKELYSHKKSDTKALRKKEEDIARKEIPLFLLLQLQKI